MNKYVVTIQMPNILGKIFEEIDEEEKKDLQDLFDLLEEFENETEYANIYLNGELMVVFQAPSDKSARGLYKLIKKMFKKSAKKYELGFELLAVSEDSRLTSLLYEES